MKPEEDVPEKKEFITELKSFADFLDDEPEGVEDTTQQLPEANRQFDQFEIKEIVGTGGIKVIYKAFDTKTARYIALAQLKDKCNTATNKERFLREARILSSLEHSNIVPIYDIGNDTEGQVYMAMKLLSGETLASIIKKIQRGDAAYSEKYDLKTLLNIFIHICDAINFAHSKGIAHLDIKPDNIQISEFNEVVLIDWGMAKKTGSLGSSNENVDPSYTPICEDVTLSGNISGTPGYMSPEQASDSNAAEIPSDIYSLGATLYAIAFLKRPYYGIEVNDIIHMTKDGDPPNFQLTRHGKNVSPTLIAIISKAMKHKAEDRYKSTSDLRDDVFRYLNDFSTQAEDINFYRLMMLFYKRHYKYITAAISVLLIITIISITFLLKLQKKDEIITIQNKKEKAVFSDIIAGISEQDKTLREQQKYKELIEKYDELIKLGYDYPKFRFEQARLYAGELELKKSMEYLKKILASDSKIKDSKAFSKLYHNIEQRIDNPNKDINDHAQLMIFNMNLDIETQRQVFYNAYNNESKSIEQKLEDFRETLLIYNKRLNPNEFNYSYKIENGEIFIDLSGNADLQYILPILSIPVDHLDISSNNQINLAQTYEHLKKELTSFNLSEFDHVIPDHYVHGSHIKKLIARDSYFAAIDLAQASNLKYLDIQGADLPDNKKMTISPVLEFINIAYTSIDVREIANFPNLKTVIIDESHAKNIGVISKFDERSVEVIIKGKNESLLDRSLTTNSTILEAFEYDIQMRKQHKYKDIITHYKRLRASNMEDPKLWMNEAKLYAGELKFSRVKYCLNNILKFDSAANKDVLFKTLWKGTRQALNIEKSRPLNIREIVLFSRKLDNDIRKHLYWKLNNNPKMETEDIMNRLKDIIIIFNLTGAAKVDISADTFIYEYQIQEDGTAHLDLSKNPNLRFVLPLYGAPISKLNLSNTIANISVISDYIKNKVHTLNISNYIHDFTTSYLNGAGYQVLIAKNTNFTAYNLEEAKNLKLLNLEGSSIAPSIRPSNTIEELNIAYSDFQPFEILPEFKKLKTLIIDKSMDNQKYVLDKLRKSGVQIVYK